MGETNRQKVRRLREYTLSQETLSKKPTPTVHYWTDHELAEMDKMKSILEKLQYQISKDIDLASELIHFSYLFGYSRRLNDIKSKVAHYRTLSQFAAQEKLWDKIRDNFCGLDTELTHLRNSRLRGGTKVQ